MGTPKEIEAAAKKMQAATAAYHKSQQELNKANINLSKYDAIIKGGNIAQMGPATVELSKIATKIGSLHKKVADNRKKMDEAIKALSKVMPK